MYPGLVGSNTGWLSSNAGKGLYIYTSVNAAIRFGINTVEAGRFAIGGNFGINTTTPSEKLDVAGNINISGASAFKISGSKVLWNNGNNIDLFVGYHSLNPGNGGAMGNTYIGYNTGNGNTVGWGNSAVGYEALRDNTTVYLNISLGTRTLFANQTGAHNIAIGYNALSTNTGSFGNIAIGSDALKNHNDATNFGNSNIAIGLHALINAASCYGNVVVGYDAMYNASRTTGGEASKNTAIGSYAANILTTGTSNVFLGYNSGATVTTGSQNVFIGDNANADAGTYNNVSAIGQGAIVKASNTMVFGNGSVVGWGFGTAPTINGIDVKGDINVGAAKSFMIGGNKIIWNGGNRSGSIFQE